MVVAAVAVAVSGHVAFAVAVVALDVCWCGLCLLVCLMWLVCLVQYCLEKQRCDLSQKQMYVGNGWPDIPQIFVGQAILF